MGIYHRPQNVGSETLGDSQTPHNAQTALLANQQPQPLKARQNLSFLGTSTPRNEFPFRLKHPSLIISDYNTEAGFFACRIPASVDIYFLIFFKCI
jgi:hypothetical protein